MSALLEAQCRFAHDLAGLIQYAESLGYKIKIGEVLRSDEQAEINALGFSGRKALGSLIEGAFPLLAKKITNNRGNGIRNSVHCLALAADVQLFDASSEPWKWVQDAYHYTLLADYWEALSPDHKAGVRWGDTPHFSIGWNGAK